VEIPDEFVEGIGAVTPKEEGNTLESKFDVEYKESNKKHRNVLSNLDHLYKVISHKSTIVIILVITFLVFIITRYVGLARDNKNVILQISQDAGTALTYIITIIGTISCHK
jgi:hypothetical protein